MENTELKAKLENIENLEQFVADLQNAADEEEVKAVLAAHRTDLTLEQLGQLELDPGELDEEALDMVAGGWCRCKGVLKRIVTNVIIWIVCRITGKRIKCHDCNH